MKKIKKLFATPAKAALTILCLAAIIGVIGAGSAFAAGTVAQGTSIGAENAANFAFADAGVDPAAAEAVHTEFDFERGQFVYEVDFIAEGTKYEYLIKASDGSVVKKEMEIFRADGSNFTAAAQITADDAKDIALKDAGLSASDVTFTKEKLDLDDGVSVYDIEFYTSSYEYEYEINAAAGSIRSRDVEPLKTVGNAGNAGNSGSTGNGSAGSTDQGNAGNVTGAGGNGGASGSSTGEYIGVDSAKSIAVGHAGFAVSDVTFSKAKLDREDGYMVYEVEFYKDGMEYEYTINALTGAILEHDLELHDSHEHHDCHD